MATDARDYEDDLAYIENHVGRISGNPRNEVIDALDEDKFGVRALAVKIGMATGLDSPVAVFIASIRRGDHRERTGSGEKVLILSPTAAYDGFFVEYREWLLDAAELDENRAIEWALDYATSSMSIRQPRIEGKPVRITAYEQGQSPLVLEDEKRAALGRPRPVTEGEERVRMNVEWTIINLCLHDKPLAAMHRALMEQCAIPSEPSHEEGRLARAALIDEIRARGVAPRRPAGPLGDALADALESYGAKLSD